MAERPILFSAPMVRAILEGRKTQTRRVMRVQPDEDAAVTVERFHQTIVDRNGNEQPGAEVFGAWWRDGECGTKCPHGELGDKLWVRETFRFAKSLDHYSPAAVAEKALAAGYSTPWAPIQYESDGQRRNWRAGFDTPPTETVPGKTRVSIHMSRWASRITLEITDVRVERLQAISHGDVIAEGVDSCAAWKKDEPVSSLTDWRLVDKPRDWPGVPGERFARLWESINGAGSWAANPFVWVLDFRRVEAPTT